MKWTKDSGQLFERFAVEYEEYSLGGEMPKTIDENMQYALEVQKNRHAKQHISLQYDIEPSGTFKEEGLTVNRWSDRLFSTHQNAQTVSVTRIVEHQNKKIYRKRRDMMLYATQTDAIDPVEVRQEKYLCSNCGNITTVEELENGCPYCGTHYQFSQLYPKVTNFFLVENDTAKTRKQIKKEHRRFFIPSAIVLFFYYLFFSPQNLTLSPKGVILALVAAVIAGYIIGYMLYVFLSIPLVFFKAGKAVVPFLQTAGSEKRFVNVMQNYTHDFSYAYFTSKVTSYLKTVLFADDPQDLPYYEGGPLSFSTANIVDASYYGSTAFKGFQINGDRIDVKVMVYMKDLCYDGRKCKEILDVYFVDLYRNVSKPIDYHFSPRKLQCKSCGGSYDMTKHKTCPYCGTTYPIADEDWIILNVQKK